MSWCGGGLTGFAAGVMVAASVWSLLIPALEEAGAAGMGVWSFVPAAGGFWAGVLFLLALDHLIPHLHQNARRPEGPPGPAAPHHHDDAGGDRLHNIPEGMAVGVVYAGYLTGAADISAAGALALSLGIAIQNFPEGANRIHCPCGRRGASRRRAFADGVLSGIVEPLAAVFTILAAELVLPAPALAAGLCSGSHAVCGGGGTGA